MLKHLLLFFLIFTSLTFTALAQERIVSGTLSDADGSPLPGVNIIIKGTTTGTNSDQHGYYSIQTSIGATLMFSYIGFTTYEVKVTEQNSQPIGSQPEKPMRARKNYQFKTPEQAQKGVTRMGEKAPGFVLKSGRQSIQGLPINSMIPQAYAIRYMSPRWAGIRYGKAGQHGMFVVQDRFQQRRPIQLSFTSAFTIDKVYKAPALQNAYAQGRPVNGKEQWQGPETGEIFSWGPKLANLEYDGRLYSYHTQGNLVARGKGNGQQANNYNPYSFFPNGISTDNSLSLHHAFGETKVDIGFQRKQQSYIVPNSDYFRHNINFKINTPIVYRLDASYSFYYSQAEGNLLSRGANMTSIFSGIVRTPPSFDNANGFSGKQMNTQAYILENGTPRSYSPGSSDNPYWMVNTLPDEEKVKTLLSTLHLNYAAGYSFAVDYNLGIDRQWSSSQHGLAPLSAGSSNGRFTQRHDRQNTIHSILTPSFRKHIGNFSLEASTTYDLTLTDRNLNRTDAFGFPDAEFDIAAASSSYQSRYLLNRTAHELTTVANLLYDNTFNVKLTNQSYFSSTLPQSKIFLPGAGIGFVFTNLRQLQNASLLPYGRLYTSYARSIKEAPLLYSRWQFNSTSLSLTDYLNYFEDQELAAYKGLQPEQFRKWEYGIALNLFNYRIGAEFLYFDKLTKNTLVPTFANNTFALTNSADISNKGYELSLQYKTYSEKALNWQSKLSLTSFRPVVTKVYGQEQRIPVAGFREVSTNIVAGQPYGIIYGSTYQRNEEGRLMIGPNGFPLVNQEPKSIGNPNPDWIAGLENTLSWKSFDLSLIVDIRKGGDVWNGTRQALNYVGMSLYTQEARNIRNYIFEGVSEDGSANTQPVDFANPAKGIAGNRWVQYGIGGVAEEAIEDGSWIRLNEVKLACQLHKLIPRVRKFPHVTLSLVGKNLLLLTRYSGVDPATSLFGYEAATGLDFFNLPATRSYGMSLNIKL